MWQHSSREIEWDRSSSNGKVAKQQQTYLDYTLVETTVEQRIYSLAISQTDIQEKIILYTQRFDLSAFIRCVQLNEDGGME